MKFLYHKSRVSRYNETIPYILLVLLCILIYTQLWHDLHTIVNRLGEACSHIATIASCMINAREARQQTGADSCTSTLCGWGHLAREVRMNYACVVIM